ncbi:hypothetical protein PGT21_024644 [Puccinia graminis f. sp. tritici]|uniref:Uncharacterized protein n=1 Tax=Puccinia graminis f. sp. tritici TaxID=56615 RepID=A0A5B0QJM3_PUCGR|nr:hypothetical protein PGT21_024644 [Puccinia graminis f. sp. tritici]
MSRIRCRCGPQRHLTFSTRFRCRATKSKLDLQRHQPPRNDSKHYDHRQSHLSKFPFLANQRPSVGSPSSSSAISIADSPSNTNSPRFSANDPPSSHDPFNDLFSIDLFNSLLVLLAVPPLLLTPDSEHTHSSPDVLILTKKTKKTITY